MGYYKERNGLVCNGNAIELEAMDDELGTPLSPTTLQLMSNDFFCSPTINIFNNNLEVGEEQLLEFFCMKIYKYRMLSSFLLTYGSFIFPLGIPLFRCGLF